MYHAETYYAQEQVDDTERDMVLHAVPQSGILLSSPAAAGGQAARSPQEVTIRKTFPETWLFDNLEFDSS